MTGFDQHDAFDPVMYGQQRDTTLHSSYEVPKCANRENELDIHDDFYFNGLDSVNWDPIAHQNNSVDELSWDIFINDSAWNNDQQSAIGHAFS